MAIVLHHHPYSRAANVVWMLEELGEPYELRFVDIMTGAHKKPDLVSLNPMGKFPVLQDGDAIVTESAATGSAAHALVVASILHWRSRRGLRAARQRTENAMVPMSITTTLTDIWPNR